MKRCTWVPLDHPEYIEYHDKVWGVPVHDDQKLFEFITLEGAQAGLSWSTILKKREGYRQAFANFDVKKVSKFMNKKVDQLLENPGIVRNRLKVESTISNAKAFLEVQKEFGSFDSYIWSFVDGSPIQNKFKKTSQILAETPLSKQISKDLKKRDFRFVGPTIIYAFMQAIGMVNDHSVECFRHKEL
jgi:DNA-3-methyladenine glycosylase I